MKWLIAWFIVILCGIFLIVHSKTYESEQKVQINAVLVSKEGIEKAGNTKDKYQGTYSYNGTNITTDISLTAALNQVVGQSYVVPVDKYLITPSLQSMHNTASIDFIMGVGIIILFIVIPLCLITGIVPIDFDF